MLIGSDRTGRCCCSHVVSILLLNQEGSNLQLCAERKQLNLIIYIDMNKIVVSPFVALTSVLFIFLVIVTVKIDIEP